MKALAQKALEDAYVITKRSIGDFRGGFPSIYTTNNIYQKDGNTDWTTGFYTGTLWLLYELTKDEVLKEVAKENVESFRYRIDNHIETDNHDLGFLYSLSCVADYKLTGDVFAKETALLAADELLIRYREKGEFIQAWGKLDDKNDYRLIIDCLLNIPLLYWATEVTGDKNYHEKAYKHLQTCLKHILREDNSTYHTFFFNLEDGTPSHGQTHQGYKNDSTWARGQAWGIYGTALSYQYTNDPMLIEKFKCITEYFMRYLPEDDVPYWDLTFVDGDEPRDSSSAAIAVCGMLEMKKFIQDEAYCKQLDSYIERMMTSLMKNYAAKPSDTTNGILYKGTYGRKSIYNDCIDHGVNECVIWGDYFYVEALTRIVNPDWKMYW